MTIRTAFTGALLAASLALPAFAAAERNQLGEPVVALMPHVKAMRADLGLNEQQNSTLDNWIAEAPARRQQLEGETLAERIVGRAAAEDVYDPLEGTQICPMNTEVSEALASRILTYLGR